jgi:hypothetical protein
LLFPNPAADHLTLRLPTGAPADVRVFDATGRIVRVQQALVGTAVFDLVGLTAGTYTVELRTSDRVQRARFVKR